jgi:hypothetical protein
MNRCAIAARKELVELGLVQDSGKRRPDNKGVLHVVWRAQPHRFVTIFVACRSSKKATHVTAVGATPIEGNEEEGSVMRERQSKVRPPLSEVMIAPS